MSASRMFRMLAIAGLMLAALSACGQMGPLQLPDDGAAPVTGQDPQDEDREDDER